jgi:hypothetical protein
MATIVSSKLVRRCSCLPMRRGSNVPSRSRGTSMRSAPTSVSTDLALLPLRWIGGPSFGHGLTWRVTQVVTYLGTQARSRSRLLKLWKVPFTLSWRHRSGNPLRQALRPSIAAAPLCALGRLRLAWQSCTLSSRDAAHTKFLTGTPTQALSHQSALLCFVHRSLGSVAGVAKAHDGCSQFVTRASFSAARRQVVTSLGVGISRRRRNKRWSRATKAVT